MATALFCPTRTTSRLPRVTPVYRSVPLQHGVVLCHDRDDPRLGIPSLDFVDARGVCRGTGSYYFESCSGVYNELQCGSYAFMDADYGRILDRNGERIDKGEWENALFILTSGPAEIVPDAHIIDGRGLDDCFEGYIPLAHLRLRATFASQQIWVWSARHIYDVRAMSVNRRPNLTNR